MKGVEESGIYPAVGHVGLDLRREVGDDHYSMVVRTKEQILTRGEGGISQGWEQRVGAWCIQQVSQRVVNEAKC